MHAVSPPHPTPSRAARLGPWLALATGAILAACAACVALWGQVPDAGWLQQHQQALLGWQAQSPWLFGLGFFALFTVLSALALPGCSLLALAAGLHFGWAGGTLLVTLASAVGATLSFLAARHWWRDAVRRRWGHRLGAVEERVRRHGALALFWLRLAPVIPFPVLNPLMGLSAMPTATFFTASALGMLAGSAAWVYAGSALVGAAAWQDLLAPQLWLALAAAVLLPWAAREAWRRRLAR
jgi:uncharacterized membrane protein YdjX (TVP38/TMEM64 family)